MKYYVTERGRYREYFISIDQLFHLFSSLIIKSQQQQKTSTTINNNNNKKLMLMQDKHNSRFIYIYICRKISKTRHTKKKSNQLFDEYLYTDVYLCMSPKIGIHPIHCIVIISELFEAAKITIDSSFHNLL